MTHSGLVHKAKQGSVIAKKFMRYRKERIGFHDEHDYTQAKLKKWQRLRVDKFAAVSRKQGPRN